jgi:hypothetical protein
MTTPGDIYLFYIALGIPLLAMVLLALPTLFEKTRTASAR